MTQLSKETIREIVKQAAQYAQPSHNVTAQGGGGGVETRYRGASRGLRSLLGWLPGVRSAIADLPTNERQMLVGRSRDAMRNHLIARAAIMRQRTSVVGTGLVCYAQVNAQKLGISTEQAQELNSQLDLIWEMYALNPVECDAEATLNHYQLQGLVLISALVNGDAFVATPYIKREGTQFGTRLQVIEADRVCNPADGFDTENMVDGVEFDKYGAPIAYHIASTYKIDRINGNFGERKWQRLPAFGKHTGRRRTLHVMNEKERPGQKRGVPYLAPVLEPLQKLERYSSAELMAAVISAFFTVFIKKTDGFNDGGLPMAAMGSHVPTEDTGTPDIQLGEGAIVDLGEGEEPVTVNPARPNAQFDPFFTAVVKQIGAALEIPIEELLLNYDKSYSAARAAMLQAWRYYSLRRWWLVSEFCKPTRELVIDEAVAKGMINLPNYVDPIKRHAYLNALWVGPARGAIDELKEANAAGKRIEIGVSNVAMECAAMSGEPYADIYSQRLLEIQKAKQDGIYTEPQAKPTSSPPIEDEKD
ncbi:phage portal protein [Pseudomonas sp. F1_0610]|uniref:phage portal protein n=1 Tax=Pseudomonas sp. F1_0610 TaxID=3114284 RepID=UPI0039C2AFD9